MNPTPSRPAASRTRWLPGLQLLRHYPADWWRHDVAAGLVLTTMLVPVGIAYAVASGLPGIHGLYATITGLLAYALFGPSRILVMGPDSSLAALILAVVLPLAAGDPARAVALAGAMALAVGSDLHRRRAGQAGLHHRVAVQTHPLRLHERHCARGHRQPAAQAVRHHDCGRRPAGAGRGFSAGAVGRAAQCRGLRRRRGLADADPAVEALAADTRHADRPDRRHRCGAALRPGRPARCRRARCVAAGAAVAVAAVDWLGRLDAGAGRRAGRRAGGLCRHQRAVAHLCAAPAHRRRPEPGDGGAGRDQPGGRACSRVSPSAAVRRARRWPRPPVRARR